MLGRLAPGTVGLGGQEHRRCGAAPSPPSAQAEGAGGGEKGWGQGDTTGAWFSLEHLGRRRGLGCCPTRCSPGSWGRWSSDHRPTGMTSNDRPHWLPVEITQQVWLPCRPRGLG